MNLDRINALLREFAPSSVAEMEIEEPGLRLKAKRAHTPARPAAPKPVKPSEAEGTGPEQLYWIEAGLVGIFHAADPPVALGSRVTAGQVVGILESMRIPNPIRSDQTGVVSEVSVADGDAVEYGQPLYGLQAEG